MHVMSLVRAGVNAYSFLRNNVVALSESWRYLYTQIQQVRTAIGHSKRMYLSNIEIEIVLTSRHIRPLQVVKQQFLIRYDVQSATSTSHDLSNVVLSTCN